MAVGRIKSTELSAIAAAIRQKNGLSTIYKPGEMAAAIRAIPTGITPTGAVNITQNGTTDVTQYASANVNVPNSYAAGDEGKVVSNGVLVAQGSDTVTQNGTVDTTLISSLVVNVSGGGGSLPTGLYVGEGTPDASIGSNGDVYFQYDNTPANIASNGNAYILTDVGIGAAHSVEVVTAITQITSRWDIIFEASYSPASAKGLCSACFSDESPYGLIYSYARSKTGTGKLITDNSYTKSGFLNKFRSIKFAKNLFYVDDTLVHTFSKPADSAVKNNLCLFGRADESDSQGYVAIAEVKVWDPNDTLVAHLLPYQNNGAACLKDDLSGTIYSVSGTAMTYKAGGYTYVATWVKSGGSWAVAS